MRPILALLALLCVAVPGLASAQSFLETFDGTSAPCNFNQQSTPANNYTSGGVTLSNGFKVLDQCGNFSVTGYSAPNFLAWNTCCSSTTETLTFAAPASAVSIRVGSGSSVTVTATARNAGGTVLQTLSVAPGSTLQTLSFSVSEIATVTLSVSGGAGVWDDLAYTLNANNDPVADAGGPYTVGQGAALTMDGSGSTDSDGSIVLYEWDCTDNGSYDVSSPSPTGVSCTYPDDGTQTVRLRVTDDDGAQATDTATVTVTNALPTADAGGPYITSQGGTIAMNGLGSADSDGSITLYEWDCTSDGTYDVSSASGFGSLCTYPDDGTFTLTLRVTDDDNGQATDTATVTVPNAPPQANAGGPYTVGQTVALALDGSGSSDPDGTLTLYEWDCTSDGTYDTSSASPTASTCTYPDVGSATVTLRVTDDDGGQATATASVTITNALPVADAGGPYTVNQGAQLDLDGSGSSDSDGAIALYEWDCTSDGTYDVSSSSSLGACTYPDDGTATVTLRVTDDDGGQATDTATVTIENTLPTAHAGGPYSGDEGVAIALDGTSSSDSDGTLSTWEWDCETDGTYELSSSSGTGDSCTYGNEGSYTVTLRVTDDDGGQATATATVTVANVAPTLSNLSVPNGDEGATLTFSVTGADVAGDTLTYTWDFGDSATGSGATATHAYADDGAYTVTVTVTDGTDSDTLSGTATIANVAPEITSTAPTTATEGSAYTYAPTVTDPGTEVFVWTLSPGAPTGMTVDGGTGAISWTPTYDQALVGSWSLVLTVDDGDGATDAESWTIAVSWLDSDSDGLPDGWENANGLDPNDGTDASADPDGDGLTNLDEFNGGTDPNSFDGPTAPTAYEPIGGVEVGSDSPDLVVDNATDPQGDVLTYEFEVYSDAALTTLVTSTTGVAETATQTEWKVDLSLTENTEYWWRARAADANAAGPWTMEESFVVNTANEAPAVPVLSYPIDGETVSTLTPTFVWQEAVDADGDAVTYDVELSDADGNVVDSATGIVGDGSEGEWSGAFSLIEDATYTWTARAVDEDGAESDWAEAEAFFVSTENGAPDSPVFTEPLDGASVATLSPTLVATEVTDPEGDVITYEFSVDTVASFDSADLEQATVPASGTGSVSWDLSADGVTLPENGLAYARVRAVDAGGVASVPDTISFFVRGENDLPSVPVLLAPEDGGEGDDRPVFEVQDPTDGEGDLLYIEFLVARDESLDVVVLQTTEGIVVNGTGTTTWTPTDALAPGTIYWTARAVDELGGESAWAEPWSYTIDDGSSGDDDDDSAGGGGAGGCENCNSSVAGGPASAAWLLLLLVPLARRRR